MDKKREPAPVEAAERLGFVVSSERRAHMGRRQGRSVKVARGGALRGSEEPMEGANSDTGYARCSSLRMETPFLG